MISWVIGRGGLLGQSVESALENDGPVFRAPFAFSWGDALELGEQLRRASRAFAEFCAGESWQIAWCAGSGVVGTQHGVLDAELAAFERLLNEIARAFGPDVRNGALFVASSAGGVYAGVGDPPYSELSPVAPLAAYGEKKLQQEEIARLWCDDASVPLLIGRLSNLYGPRQNFLKPQGLITQVFLRIVARQPLHLYVSLDTIRDYLFADDAGRLVASGLRRLRTEADRSSTVPSVLKILASQQPVTIATVLAQVRWITKRPVSVIVGTTANSRFQVRDLRMTSTVWPELDAHQLTSLSEGMRTVFSQILRLAGSGALHRDALSVH